MDKLWMLADAYILPKMPFLSRHLLTTSLFIVSTGTLLADTDNDGLRDSVETNTGIYVSPENTGTNPNLADTDGDYVPDGIEVTHGTNPVNTSSKRKRPNIIFILADDMGYGDVGCFWQNQRTGIYKFTTPGLDAMASQGAMLTHHYASASICAPTRASFLEGKHQGHSSIRDAQFDAPLPATTGLPRMLQMAGYKTVHIGKAGLAGRDINNPTAHPMTRGFDRFFGYLTHAQAHEHYPRNGSTDRKAVIWDDYTKITNAHVDLYTSDVYTAVAKKIIIDESQTNPDRPFFIYLAYDTPHFIGQFAPTRDYPSGSGEAGGIQWTGSPSYVNTATNNPANINNIVNRPQSVNPAWHGNAQRFVAMIHRMDQSISDILQTLRDRGIDDDTLVVFSTDNGPDPTEVVPNDFGSVGPFEGIKGDLLDGGIRVPTIAWWPGKIPSAGQPGQLRQVTQPSAHYDWLATFASMAGVVKPAFADGTSLLPALEGLPAASPPDFHYFEMSYNFSVPLFQEFPNNGGRVRGQMQAIRIGDHMGVRYNILNSGDPFRIYNMVTDPKQGIDLAQARPELHQRMQRLAIGARRPSSAVPRNYDTALIPAFIPVNPVRNGLNWKSYEGHWSWLPDFRTLTPATSGQSQAITTSVLSRESDVGLSFDGYLSIATAGTYTFQTASSSETSLWIHESHVINNDLGFTPVMTSGAVHLSAGLHPIRLYFRHRSGTPSLDLRYSGPGIPLQTIPASSLYIDGPPPVFNLQPDTCLTKRNQSVWVDALANDSCSYPITLASAVASSGTATIVAGKILFNPANDFYGSTTIPYTVTTGTTTATSTITADVLFDDELWISLDEGTGTAARAISAAGVKTGVLAGTTNPNSSWLPRKSGTCLSFDGVAMDVVFPDLAIPIGSSPRTFTCWVRTSATVTNEYQTIFSHGGDATIGQRFTIRLDNVPGATNPHRLRLEVNGGSVVGTRPINDSKWHHLAVVLSDWNNSGQLNINETLFYVDGIVDPISAVTPANISITNGFPPTLGGSSHASNFNFTGEIDDVRIFPRALSAAEINTLGEPTVILPSGDDDTDGDGASDLLEFVAGTDSQNPKSVFRIDALTRTESGMVLQWTGVAGRTYRVEESTGLSVWTLVPGIAPVVVTTAQPVASVTVPANGAPKRFLRIQVMQTP